MAAAGVRLVAVVLVAAVAVSSLLTVSSARVPELRGNPHDGGGGSVDGSSNATQVSQGPVVPADGTNATPGATVVERSIATESCVPGLPSSEPALASGAEATIPGGGNAPSASMSTAASVTSAGPRPSDPSLASAIATARASGICPGALFVPRAAASPAEVARTAAVGSVVPTYQGIPAPIGVADYGISEGAKGSVVPSVLNTTRLRGSVDADATGIWSFQPDSGTLISGTPDAFSVQLNAVLTYVDLFGHETNRSRTHAGVPYEFWAQNVVEYYPGSEYMILVTNLWNFSGRFSLGPAIYQHGPDGQVYGGLVYEAAVSIPTPISYPFNLTLFLNSTVVAGRDAVYFSAELTGPGEQFREPFDYVIFNSTGASGRGATGPASFTADGEAYDPANLTNDFELDIGGPGNGAQADLFAADAQLGLAYWDAGADGGAGGFVAVPSAFNFGGETGETATGGNVAWSNAPGGPAGLPTYATMTTGPTLLAGLWNASGPEGSEPVTIDSSPSNAFEIVRPMAAAWGPIAPAGASVGPTETTSTFWLAPGNYTLTTELSDFTPERSRLDVVAPLTLYVNLTANSSLGVYTPLWAWSNAQLAALSTHGTGVPSDPYVVENNQYAPLGPTFGLYNDYGYPVFPAVFFLGTTASVELLAPSNFSTETNTTTGGGSGLFPTNDPPFWFDNVSGVALRNASDLGGWEAIDSDQFASVVFYESSESLVAGCTFHGGSTLDDLLLYSGGSFFGPTIVGGGNNTVWGNTFQLSGKWGNVTYSGGVGLWVAEPNDLVYNNRFVPGISHPVESSEGFPWYGTDAFQSWWNFYTGQPARFLGVRWNISVQPASTVHFAAGFPTVPLVGSALGTTWQGGSYWWDYGLADNPYGRLPFDSDEDGAGIQSGGDYAPLVAAPLYRVTVGVTGLPAGDPWRLELTNGSSRAPTMLTVVFVPLDNATTTAASITVYLPNGSFPYLISGPAGYHWTQGTIGPTGNLTVTGANATENAVYAKGSTLTITFREERLRGVGGYLPGLWCVAVAGWEHCSVKHTIRFANLTASPRFHGSYLYAVIAEPPYYAPVVLIGGRSASPSGSVVLHRDLTIVATFVAE